MLAADEHCEEIHPKLLFFMFDGCRHGVEASLLQPFKKQSDNKTMVKSKHQLYVLYDEAGLSRRRGCVRGPNALDQVEFIHLVSASPVKVADKKRIHYDGTSFGNCLGPVTVAAAADVWCVDMSIKKTVYGVSNRVDVGGKVPGMETIPTKDLPAINSHDPQPMCYHPLTKTLLQELTHCYNIAGWINCTGNEGTLEEMCIESRLPCFSICFTDVLTKLLKDQLVKQTFARMQESDSPIFHPGLMSILGKKVQKKAADGVTELKGKKRAHAKVKEKAKAKAKPKVGAKTGSKALKKLQKMQEEAEEDENEESDGEYDEDDCEDSGDEL